ncbi:3-hydroxyisobutyrate dehydrogenase [Vulcanimicrobium alpinum]|uniref:3-hydroxyisobutyrate dehydrogenase n=1 Tax=Vulcanimicrobium alpinum TaxID=3016050 RepID=A0AAN1XWN4_UNVUL|nr:NAD(P)-dependent oxidoreductase [Vulcanimicrobium alpinum]BDE06737.1 3-hydroxyisobutyrate dehydrogenase [Vulcanimicrobium alpinum]
MIAYFGTGLLGSGFVRKLIENGETVHVWNRTLDKARALEADGAKVFDNPADAARGASEIHLTLSDDAAVDAVLEPLAEVILSTAFIADHTTTAPTPTAERVARWKQRGRTFVHAPVFMGPKNARDATGLMLVSGAPEVRERVRPRFENMTGKVVDLGDDPARAAAFKLFGNLMLLVIGGGIADMFRLGRSLGIEPQDAYTLFNEFNPGNSVGVRGKAMSEGVFTPANFELTMARKDLRLMMDEAARHGEKLDVVPAVATLMDRYIAAGHGSEDVGVIGSRG